MLEFRILIAMHKIGFYIPFGAVPKVMSVAIIEPVEMTITLNVVVSTSSTTVMQTYWTTPRQKATVKTAS